MSKVKRGVRITTDGVPEDTRPRARDLEPGTWFRCSHGKLILVVLQETTYTMALGVQDKRLVALKIPTSSEEAVECLPHFDLHLSNRASAPMHSGEATVESLAVRGTQGFDLVTKDVHGGYSSTLLGLDSVRTLHAASASILAMYDKSDNMRAVTDEETMEGVPVEV